MKIFLSSLSTVLATGLTVGLLPLFAWADSTADLLVALNCDDYHVQIWQDRTSDSYLYRAQGFTGDLALDNGSRTATEGVVVYKFQNDNYEYWVWDGNLDSSDVGQLEVYYNNRIVMQRACTK